MNMRLLCKGQATFMVRGWIKKEVPKEKYKKTELLYQRRHKRKEFPKSENCR